MTQEDKELLLRDLYARLPYGVKFKGEYDEDLQEIHYIKDEGIYTRTYPHLPYWIETIKPYLRPMSSMTDEERKDFYHNRIQYDGDMFASESGDIDWLNAHHFDYRGLIEKGLAIAVTEENNPYKEK